MSLFDISALFLISIPKIIEWSTSFLSLLCDNPYYHIVQLQYNSFLRRIKGKGTFTAWGNSKFSASSTIFTVIWKWEVHLEIIRLNQDLCFVKVVLCQIVLKVRFCQKILMFLSYLQTDKLYFVDLNFGDWKLLRNWGCLQIWKP